MHNQMSITSVFLFLICFHFISASELIQKKEGGKSFCVFTRTTAICSHHGKKLWYIPKLKENITSLDFSYNELQNVTHYTFSNVTLAGINLTNLQLKFDRIRYISRDAFSGFKYLANLSLNGNNILPEILSDAFIGISMTPVQRLDLINIGLTSVPEGFFLNLNSSQITHLHLHMNYFQFFNISDLKYIPNLIHIGLSQNVIIRVFMHETDTLKELDIAFNIVRNICSHSKYVPSLTYLDWNFNSVYYMKKNVFDCLPNLQHLLMNGNFLKTLTTDMFSNLPNLITLHLKAIPVLHKIEAYAFNNSNIKYISLKKGRMLGSRQIHQKAFAGCSSISYLDLSNNNFRLSSSDFLEKLFSPFVNNLSILQMTACSLTKIPPVISKMKKLAQLNLAVNSITWWDRNTFKNLHSLKKLCLNQNQITVVSEDSVPETVRQGMDSVDLSSNPFDCSCPNLWFIKWFRANQTLFSDSQGTYECASPNKIKLLDWKIEDQTCLLSFTARMFIIFGFSLLIVAGLIITVLYKYRWHIRYVLYMACLGKTNVNEENRVFMYDAFILYSANDADWVLDSVVPVMEERHGLKLCIHERDFKAGLLIIDNIMKSINQSRKLVIVLSNSFSESEWCHFEMDIIQRELLENRHDLPVVIMLEELNKRRMTESMCAVLMSTTYIKWPDDDSAVDMFWDKLVRIIQQ